jgi:hypothetical protein
MDNSGRLHHPLGLADHGGMPVDRRSLKALRNLIADTDLILETTPDLPRNRTACCRESLKAALALVDDITAYKG